MTPYWPWSAALERAVGNRLISVPGLRAGLARWPTPTALRTAGKARVRTLISKHSKRTAPTLTAQTWTAPRAQTVTVVAEATWDETIGDVVRPASADDRTEVLAGRLHPCLHHHRYFFIRWFHSFRPFKFAFYPHSEEGHHDLYRTLVT